MSANVSEAATEDQASDHSPQTYPHQRAEFDLDVTEKPPTQDQLRTIIDYVGNPGNVVSGAGSVEEAMRKFRQDAESFKRPVVRTLRSAGTGLGAGRESRSARFSGAGPRC